MLIGADDLIPLTLSLAERRCTAQLAQRAVAVEIAGTPCEVRFSAPAAAEIFARRFADLRPVHGRPALHAFALWDRGFGNVFWRCDGTVYHWPGPELEPGAVAFFADAVAITEFFEAHPRGAISIHAAAAGTSDGVAAIIGNSNAGKTTTALACVRAGLQLYSDERCAIAAGAVHPFPRAVNVRAGGRRLLASDAARDPLALYLEAAPPGDLSDVRYRELFGEWQPPAPAALRSIFLLRGVDARPALEPVRAIDIARAAVRWTHGAGRGMDRLATMLDLFGSTACYAMTLGSPDESAQLIAATLRRDAADRRRIA